MKGLSRTVGAALAVLLSVQFPAHAAQSNEPAEATACAPTASVQVPEPTAVLGGTLRITGEGWCHPDGGGSVIGLKIDEGSFSRPDASLHPNRTIWAIVNAAADGTFDEEIELPDGTETTSAPAMQPGVYTVRLLSGSLKDFDAPRTVLSDDVTVVSGATTQEDPATWGIPLVAGDATAWVQRRVSVARGTLRIAGRGWLTTTGGPSTLAIKLGSSPTAQFRRTSDVVLGDPTIWALGGPRSAGAHEFRIEADGSFDVELDLPPGLSRGDHLSVALTTGKFGPGDVQRSVFTEPLAVDGLAYVVPEDGADVPCVPTSPTPTVSVQTPVVPLGGVAVVTGEGWCHPTGGGSRIGVKIDDGAISHLDDSVHTNRTIWTIIQAEHSDGTFRAEITMPDGTTTTSAPALRRGSHTFRFLSGSLRTDDAVRTLDAEIVVGRYRPSGLPDPVAERDLRPGTRKGVEATVTGQKLRVHVPRAKKGEWLHLTAYTSDGSPRHLWNRWMRADADRELRVPIPTNSPTGRLRLVVQSGDQGTVGELRGWDDVVLARKPVRTVTPPRTPVVVPPEPAPPVEVVGLTVPEVPAADLDELRTLRPLGARADVDGDVTTITLPRATVGAPVFLTVYDRTQILPAGWVTVDSDRSVQVDLSALPVEDRVVAVQDADGALLGWVDTSAAVVGDDDPSEEGPTPVPVPEAEVARPVAARTSIVGATDGWLLGLGALVLAGSAVFVRTRKVA